MILGKRPNGVRIASRTKMGFTVSQQVVYVQDRSGDYDAIEKQFISDPWVHGYEAAEKGKTLDEALAPLKASCKRGIGTKAQRLELCASGWKERSCDVHARRA